MHLGNYLGAIKNFVELNNDKKNKCVFCVVDLHAITISQDPKELKNNIRETVATFIACGIDPKEYANKLVYLMGVDKARFRNPVIPDCELHLEIEAVRSHGRVWKYKGTAKVDGKRMADAEWSATIVDRKE